MAPAVLRDYAEPHRQPDGVPFWKGAIVAMLVGILLWDFLLIVLFAGLG